MPERRIIERLPWTERWVILDALVGIVLRYRPGSIVEIGAQFGETILPKMNTTNVLLRHAKDTGQKFYTCDIRRPVVADYNGHEHFMGSSFDFMKQFDDYPSVVMVDGCHDYEIVKEEFRFFFKQLQTGGVMFFHDTLPRVEKSLDKAACSDSYKLRQEIEGMNHMLDCFTWPYTAGNVGLTMVLKKEKDRPYYRR